jgi:hypothetical protein
MREDQIDLAERLATLENDRKVLEQRSGTFFSHGLAAANDLSGGRFAAAGGAPRVVGSTPGAASQYPAASAAHQTELPPEPPLGFSVNELDPSATIPAAEDPGAPVGAAPSFNVASSGDDGKLGDAGAPSFTPQERR